MNYPKKIIIDTSIFINPQSLIFFGSTPQQALENFIEKAKNKKVILYMPPSTFEELTKFLKETPIIPKALSYIRKKPPKKYEIFIPSLFLYELVEEMRKRINKGLRITEKYTRYGLSKKKGEQELIKALREEFRIALREGIIDSIQDVDLLILAKELESPLLSSDQGLITWAQKLGIETLNLKEVKSFLFS